MELNKRQVLVFMLSAALAPRLSAAHNNPSFEKVAIAEVEVLAEADEAGAFSPRFNLELPKGTIQLHYEVEAEDQRQARFAIASDDKVVASDLAHDATSKPIRSGDLAVVDVTGATGPFTLRILAEVMVRATG